MDQSLVLGLHVVAIQLLGTVVEMELILLGLGIPLLRIRLELGLSLLSPPLSPLRAGPSSPAPTRLPSHPVSTASYSPGGWSSRRPGSNTSVPRPSGTNSNRVITNSQNQRVRLGNTSRSSQRQSTTRQIETQRNYNQSYTPSYNSNSSRGSSISSGSSGSSRGSMSGGSRGGTGGGSRSRR